MATIPIQPVDVQTHGGIHARITGINPTNSDCIEGELHSPGQPIMGARWDLYGRMRDGPDTCNLDLSENEVADIMDTARRLGAT